jgi:DHA1 family bicyclomycin/chloramphenicol resistance-like MFS transporter
MIMLGASALNLAIALLLPEPRVPWSVLPVGLHAIGIGINFPTLTLLLLDRFPHHRGAVSSVQAFVSLVLSATLAGAISPLVSGSASCLAATAALATVLGFGCWRLYRRIEMREAPVAAEGT